MPQPESIAGRYRVVHPVGRGGMGTVWLCSDEVLHRQVAVKQVGALPGEEPGNTARAMREARLAAAVNHPNAVAIYDVVDHDGSTWLVMEYFPSQTLSQLIAAEGRLPPQRVAHIAAQVAAALSAAHALGIVHRDVKPGNILVGADDSAKISDFGIARGIQDLQLTQTGMVTGTPAFFSPELARGEDPTSASDVWALGITLYTAVEGEPPYRKDTNPLAVLAAIVQEPMPAPEHAGPLKGALAGMLDPAPDRRWTMSEAWSALQRVAGPGIGYVEAAAFDETGFALPAQGLPQPPPASELPVEPTYERAVALPAASYQRFLEPDDDQPAGSRGTGLLAKAAAVLLALLVLVGGAALLKDTVLGNGDDSTSSAGSPQGKSGIDQTPKHVAKKSSGQQAPSTDSPNTTDPETTDPETTDPETTDPETTDPETTDPGVNDPGGTGPGANNGPGGLDPGGSAGTPESFTEGYFATVPDDLDSGWRLLAPSFRKETTRDYYDSFWGSIASVNVSNVQALDADTVQYDIVYTSDDGTVSAEVKQLTLQPVGQSYRIVGDSPAVG